jgi:hypothetical protein
MLINKSALAAFASPDAGAANSLYTFLAQRFVAAYQLLDCANLVNQADPVSVTVNGQGVAVSASISAANLKDIVAKFAASKAGDDAQDSVEVPAGDGVTGSSVPGIEISATHLHHCG